MKVRYRKFKRSWGMWYAFDTVTGNSVSLKTRVRTEAVQKVNAMNEIEREPSISLGLAKVYLSTVRVGDRATEFRQRCQQLAIEGDPSKN